MQNFQKQFVPDYILLKFAAIQTSQRTYLKEKNSISVISSHPRGYRSIRRPESKDILNSIIIMLFKNTQIPKGKIQLTFLYLGKSSLLHWVQKVFVGDF